MMIPMIAESNSKLKLHVNLRKSVFNASPFTSRDIFDIYLWFWVVVDIQKRTIKGSVCCNRKFEFSKFLPQCTVLLMKQCTQQSCEFRCKISLCFRIFKGGCPGRCVQKVCVCAWDVTRGVYTPRTQRQTPSPCEQNDWQTGVKTLPSCNFICGW